MNTTTTKSAKELTDFALRSGANKNASSERRNVPCLTRFFTLEEINTRAETVTPLLNEILGFRPESQSPTGLADCRRAGNQPTKLRRRATNTDEKLKEALVTQLNFWVGNSASKIQVTLKDGIVTLRGGVPNYAEKMACVELVQRIDGVTALVDEIIVELPESMKRTDVEIAAAVANAINWITTVPLEAINITVHGGKLLLGGSVEELQQKRLVELVVRHLPGITGITNLITTKQRQN